MVFKELNNYFKKVFFIVGKFGKKKIAFLGLLIFTSMILEVFSIGLIIPVLNVLENKNFLEKNFSNLDFIQNLNHIDQIYLVVSILCMVFIIKTIFVLFLNYQQNKYTTFLQAQISELLMSQYIHMPYSNYFKRNSSELLRNLKDECGSLIFGVVSPMLNLVIEILVIIGIVTLLFTQIGIFSFSVIFLLIVFVLTYIKFTKKMISQLGNERFIFDEQIIKKSNEIFYSIREIKTYSLQNYYLNNFANILNNFAKVVKKFLTLQTLPRLGIELVLISVFSFFLIIFTLQEMPFSKITSLLALFAAASFRLMPSINRIVMSQQVLRYHVPSVEEIYREIKHEFRKDLNTQFQEINFRENIELRNISFSYTAKKKILKKLNLVINSKDRIGIIGGTGLGKSTLVDLISGLIDPDDGSILIDGKKINFSKYTWHNNIGYVSQNTTLINDTIKENIVFGRSSNFKYKYFKKILKDVDLLNFVQNLKSKTNTIIGDRGINLSGGQKQRIGLARALYGNPKILFLDEAFSALDIKTEKRILNSIFKNYRNITIINIAHKGTSLKYCNKIFLLKNGKLIKSLLQK
jgi:ABC-type multidrug transport system fused ATPase/permease subunit